MSKSSKKRRLAAKRRKQLEQLRGVSLLDSASPVKPFVTSPDPRDAAHLKNYGWKLHATNGLVTLEGSTSVPEPKQAPLPLGSETTVRKRMDFVLPRALGKSEKYIFHKQARVQLDEDLPTINEGIEPGSEEQNQRPEETIDDIFYSKKKKNSSHVDVSNGTDHAKAGDSKRMSIESVQSPGAKKKRRRRRSSSLQSEGDPIPDESSITLMPAHKSKRQKRESKKSGGGNDPSLLVNNSEQGQLSGRSVEEAVKDKHGLRPRANSTDGELNLPQRGLCDEQMVLKAHRWNDDMNYVHQTTPKGFVNLGNTCFLNSILQCLAHLPPFCQSLVTISEAKGTLKNGMNRKSSQGQKITALICSLFQKVHGFNGWSQLDGALAPQAIVRALPSIGSCGSRNGYKFELGRQEDAHEFLVHLLEAMHDGELRGAGINQQSSGWRDRLPVLRLDETTFVHRIFGGYFRSQVRCRKCGYKSNTYDPFMDLSLEVSKKSSNSILYALSDFTRKETLDSDNQWKCSGCKEYVCATKQLTVFRPPLSLCIQLKRFAFDGGFGGKGFSSYGTAGWKYGKSNAAFRGESKITKPIQFPSELDLPLSDGRSCGYNLTGVVIHVGGSASSGHYTAYVKKPGRRGTVQWYHADDSFVEPVSERTVLRQKDAYILFYCRKEVKLEFPSPPPRGMSAAEAQEFGRARAKARADSFSQQERSIKSDTMSMGSDDIEERRASSKSVASLATFETREGEVERVKTNIHPLASPSLLKEKPSKNSANVRSSLLSRSTLGTEQVPSPAKAAFPDGTVTTINNFPEYLNNTIARQTRLSHDKREAEIDSDDSTSSSSSSDSSSSHRGDSSDGAAKSTNDLNIRAIAKQVRLSKNVAKSAGSDVDDAASSRQTSPANNDESDSDSSSSSSSSGRKSGSEKDDESDEDSTSDDSSKSPLSGNRKSKEPTSRASVVAPTTRKDKDTRRKKIVVNKRDSHGRVAVMMGPRKKRSWKARATTKGAEFDLLGNTGVSRWDEEDDGGKGAKVNKPSGDVGSARSNIMAKVFKVEKSRKRKMHLDRWDALLDQGKRKKVKKSTEDRDSVESNKPKKNAFQRIQAGIQRMNKGKAKGLFRRKSMSK